MGKKKPQPLADKFVLFVLSNDRYLAGTEIARTTISATLTDPAFLTLSAEGTGYDTTPVMFVAPGAKFRIYFSGIIGDMRMPPGIIPWYEQYKKKRKAKEEDTPQ